MGLTVTPLFLSPSSFLLLFKLLSFLCSELGEASKNLVLLLTRTKKKPLPAGLDSTGFVRSPSLNFTALEGIPLGWAIRWWMS